MRDSDRHISQATVLSSETDPRHSGGEHISSSLYVVAAALKNDSVDQWTQPNRYGGFLKQVWAVWDRMIHSLSPT